MTQRRLLAAGLNAGLMLVLATTACEEAPTHPCMSMGVPGDLAQRSALYRVDVYGGEVHCAGATVVPGAPAPTLSRTFPAAGPITLDVPPGAHTLVLSAFEDSAGSVLLASACSEITLEAGAQFCLDL